MAHHPVPSRPNLEHYRGQAKSLLAAWRAGDREATQEFIDHLPKARGLSIAAARRAPLRLADAQSVIARRSGFESWTALGRHVQTLRALEGEWHFESLQVDGQDVPRAMIVDSKLAFDGDRFRMDSPEGNYHGHFVIDTTVSPAQLDINFVEGPEAGNASSGIFELDGDRLTICLALVGSSRPERFATAAGSGHALEILHRHSAIRPAGVTGGTRKPDHASTQEPPAIDPTSFGDQSSDMLEQLGGEWSAVRLVTDGEEMRADWLPFGSRISTGNEVKVIFGGQVMLHARMRIDESVQPVAIDYLHLRGTHKGLVSHGILEWIGAEVCFLMAAPGDPRPRDFSSPGSRQALSRWKRRE